MDRSIMTVYLRPNNLDKFEENPESNFMRFDTQAMLNSEFGKFCLKNIDNSEFDGDDMVRNDLLGNIPVDRISGAVKTLLLAKYNPTVRMPLVNLGDNCAESIYRCNMPEPTSWYWNGYFPKVRADQIVWFPELSQEVTGNKVHLFLIEDIPYELTNRYFDKRLKEKDNAT